MIMASPIRRAAAILATALMFQNQLEDELFIQVMGNTMTLAALGEFGMHRRWMRCITMAVLALGNHFMLLLMAISTGKLRMFRATACKELVHIIMARCACT